MTKDHQKLICPKDHFELDYEKFVPKDGYPPRCPHCNEVLSFEGAGEEVAPRMSKTEKLWSLAFFGGLLTVFAISWLLLSFKYAMLISAVFAAIGAFIYGRFIRFKYFWN
jgi:hypothetical protein